MASKKERSNSSRNASQSTGGKVDANSVSASSTVASSTEAKKPAAPVTAAVAAPVAAPVAKVVAAPVAVTAPVAAAPAAVVAETRDRTTLVALIGRLHDQDAEIARDAAATLGRLPADAQAVDALAAVLVNADGYFHSVVRAAAAAALGQLGDRRAVDALIRATGDSMAEASEEAIKALGLLGDRRALPALENVIRNDNAFFLENVRRTAQEAVARINAAKSKA